MPRLDNVVTIEQLVCRAAYWHLDFSEPSASALYECRTVIFLGFRLSIGWTLVLRS